MAGGSHGRSGCHGDPEQNALPSQGHPHTPRLIQMGPCKQASLMYTALGCGSPRRRPTQTWGGCANSTTTVTLPGSNAFSYQHYNKMTWNKMTLFKHLLYLFIHSPVSGDLGFYLFSCYYQSCCCEHSCLTLTRVKASRERIPVSEPVGHSGLDEPGGAAVTDISGDSVYVSLMLNIRCGSAGVSSHCQHSKMA